MTEKLVDTCTHQKLMDELYRRADDPTIAFDNLAGPVTCVECGVEGYVGAYTAKELEPA